MEAMQREDWSCKCIQIESRVSLLKRACALTKISGETREVIISSDDKEEVRKVWCSKTLRPSFALPIRANL